MIVKLDCSKTNVVNQIVKNVNLADIAKRKAWLMQISVNSASKVDTHPQKELTDQLRVSNVNQENTEMKEVSKPQTWRVNIARLVTIVQVQM